MSNLPTLGLREFTTTGAVLAGGKLYFYEAGTTTPKHTYPTETDMIAGTNANANPVVADAYGRFGEIYLLTDEAYKVILKTSAGAQLEVWDNVNAVALNNADTETRIQQIASNPLDQGAVGDGAADESSQVQAAIDAATGVVDLLGKTYRCDSALLFNAGDDGKTLRNGTLVFSSSADDEYLKIVGSRGSAVALTADVAAGAESISVASAAGLSSGDWLFLYSDAIFGGGSNKTGEVVRIKSISGSDVTLVEPLYEAYTQANNAAIRKLSPVQNVTLQDVEIQCSAAASGTGLAVYGDIVENLQLQNVRVLSPKGSGIEIRHGINCMAFESTVLGSAVTGIGFKVVGHSRNVDLSGCRALNLATGFDVGDVDTYDGQCRTVTLDVQSLGCTTGVNLRTDSEDTALGGVIRVPSGGTSYSDSGTATEVRGLKTNGTHDGLTVTGGGSGSGLVATGGSSGTGVKAIASASYGLDVQGDTSSPAKSAVHIEPQDAEPTGANQIGDVYVNSSGQLRICYVAGTPGTWATVTDNRP